MVEAKEVASAFSQALKSNANPSVFTFSVGQEFFKEIAKFRAARRVWPSASFNAYTSTDSGSTGQPDEDLIRDTLKVLAAVLGGADSVDGKSSERILRVIEFESGITLVPDAFAGSCYVEQLTAEMENSVREQMQRCA